MQTGKIQSSGGRMEERGDTALTVSGFQRLEFDWIQWCHTRMSEEGVRKSPWASCSFGNTHTTRQT